MMHQTIVDLDEWAGLWMFSPLQFCGFMVATFVVITQQTENTYRRHKQHINKSL